MLSAESANALGWICLRFGSGRTSNQRDDIHGLSEAVEARLKKYQADYDELVREKGGTELQHLPEVRTKAHRRGPLGKLAYFPS